MVNYPAPVGRGFPAIILLPLRSESPGSTVRSTPATPNKILILEGGRLDIDRRVDVTVMMSTAIRTDPLPMREFEIPVEIPTPITDFRGWIESPDPEQSLPILQAFVLQHREERVPRNISDPLCQMMILHHPTNVQRFHCYGLVLAHDSK